ncbi:MAG: RloB family protein [Saprospiraceae bacterium]
MARKTNHRKGKGKKVYSIIVDGETEVWYFQMMKRHEKLLSRVDIKPELPKKKRLSEQFKLVKENAKIYDEVIWLIDFDTIIKEEQEFKGNGESPIQELERYIKAFFNNKKVHLLVNMPCLEFWYLLHFEATGRYFSQCETATSSLKKHVSDYQKSQKYYTKRDNDIYKKLLPFQAKAITNATKLGEFTLENPKTAKAEIYQVFQLLGISK